MAKRVLPVSESDLRMDGDLALSIQRVLPVTQADIDAAAALGEGWVVWKVIEVAEPLDNLRGGTLRVIKQNSVQPGQNVRRVLIVQGPGGEKVVVGPGVAPLSLPDAIANSLDYVKAYGGTEQRNVPEGYTEVEYLVADGASYISTSYIPTPDSVIKTKIYATNTGSIFGSRWSPSPTYDTFGFIRTSSNFLAYYGRYSDSYYKSISASPNTLYDFVFDIGSIKLDNTTTSITREQFIATEPLCIGALNNMGTAGSFFNGRLYRLTITENGVIKADFVPCKRDSDSELGMYETVSGTFSTNDGTGTFTAGGTVSVSPSTPVSLVCNNGTLKTRHTSGLPLEYEQVEYLESSGGQYLDTGVILKGETLEVDCDFAFTTVPESDSVPRVIWGFMGPNALPRAAVFGYQGKYSFGSNNTSSLAIFIDTNKHSSVFYANGNGSSVSFMFDGYGYTGTGSPQTYTDNNLSIYLFARNNDTTGVGNWSVSRIYSGMKFKLDNVVVRDYITCRRLSDNALGMYDLVNKTFITNLGTGTFTAGSTVADPVEIYADGLVETIGVSQFPVAYRELEYITATGTQYIDTGVKLNSGSRVEISFKSENISLTQALFGCRDSASGTRNAFALWENVGSRMRFDYQSEGLQANANISTTDWNLTIKDGVSNMLNGVSQPTNTADTFSGNYSAYIFSINTTGTAGSNMVGSVAYCKIWQDGTTLSFDGVPCVRRADGVIGMYDKVSGTFFTNAGTGDFVAGDVKAGTATCEDLLSIGNYTDVQEVLSGDITRKVGIKVLDGTETVSTSTDVDSRHRYTITLSGLLASTQDVSYSTHFLGGKTITELNTDSSLDNATTVYNAFAWFYTSTFATADALKQFFADQYAAGTPVIIVYPLATATTESVAGQTLNVTSGDNVIDITQASLSGLELEAEYTKEA